MNEVIDISPGKAGKAKMGRPVLSKTLVTQKIRERFAEILAEEADPLIRAQVKAAVGNFITTTTYRDKDGMIEKTVEQEQAPNTSAAKMLVETVIGKPKETVKHEGGIGIVALIKKLEEDDTKAENGAD